MTLAAAMALAGPVLAERRREPTTMARLSASLRDVDAFIPREVV